MSRHNLKQTLRPPRPPLPHNVDCKNQKEAWQYSYSDLLKKNGYQTAFIGKIGIDSNFLEDSFSRWVRP